MVFELFFHCVTVQPKNSGELAAVRILEIDPSGTCAPILKIMRETFGNEEGTFFYEFFSTPHSFLLLFFFFNRNARSIPLLMISCIFHWLRKERRTKCTLSHSGGLGPRGLKSRVQCFRQLPFCCPPFLTKFQTPSSHPTHD